MNSRRAFRARMARPSSELLVAPLALDALSAALAVRAGFDSVYLGGGGLGYQRGVSEALLTATELSEATRAITERVDVNVVVDGGVGFGDPVHMSRTIRLIEDAGAAAIEIEDQVAPKRAHHHKGVEHLVSPDAMADRIRAAVDARRDAGFVIIVRCNAFAHEGVQATQERLAVYQEAGADVLMPMPRTAEQFAAATSATVVPLAAMVIGSGRPAAELLAAGYALSVEPMSPQAAAFRAMKAAYEAIRTGAADEMTGAEVLAVMHEIADTISMDTLYEIEAQTTERDFYP
ncbi:MAG: isocitrate lyase/phosphoenolpyruvate mutase family protein [Tepidiformaceae bacterium]